MAGEGVPGVEYSRTTAVRDASASQILGMFFITLSTLLDIHSTLDYVFGMKNPNEQPLPSYHEHQHGNTSSTVPHLVIVTGNPRVIRGYPYPYPVKPVPATKGKGFDGSG